MKIQEMRLIQQESKAVGLESNLKSLKIMNFERATFPAANQSVDETVESNSDDDDLDETDPNMAPSIE